MYNSSGVGKLRKKCVLFKFPASEGSRVLAQNILSFRHSIQYIKVQGWAHLKKTTFKFPASEGSRVLPKSILCLRHSLQCNVARVGTIKKKIVYFFAFPLKRKDVALFFLFLSKLVQ